MGFLCARKTEACISESHPCGIETRKDAARILMRWALNRTLVVLKLARCVASPTSVTTLNRTLVVLKFVGVPSRLSRARPLNRTLVVLKSTSTLCGVASSTPLNRTLVVLKLPRLMLVRLLMVPLNRTLVVLKYELKTTHTLPHPHSESHPCGIEMRHLCPAVDACDTSESHPCGIEIAYTAKKPAEGNSLNRTLVVLKSLSSHGLRHPMGTLNRTLVVLKCELWQ